MQNHLLGLRLDLSYLEASWQGNNSAGWLQLLQCGRRISSDIQSRRHAARNTLALRRMAADAPPLGADEKLGFLHSWLTSLATCLARVFAPLASSDAPLRLQQLTLDRLAQPQFWVAALTIATGGAVVAFAPSQGPHPRCGGCALSMLVAFDLRMSLRVSLSLSGCKTNATSDPMSRNTVAWWAR